MVLRRDASRSDWRRVGTGEDPAADETDADGKQPDEEQQ